MYLHRLVLKNFRNYESLDVGFDKGLNLLFGENGQGKTNILESIFFSFILKSHRTNKVSDLIKFEEQALEIELSCVRDDLRNVDIKLSVDKSGKKKIILNGVKIGRISDFIGCVKVVMFSPEDLKIVKESPQNRRKFLDMTISQIDNVYLKAIIDYNKVLDMKNRLLKESFIDDKLLDVYDYQLSKISEIVISKRFFYLMKLKEFSRKMHSEISGFKEEFDIVYVNFLSEYFLNLNSNDDIKGKIFDILKRNREIDKCKKFSGVGIHRDDFTVLINGKKVSDYSSQGQQRSAVISIKLGVVELIKNLTNEHPVLLLDDILSELDKKRRNFVVNFIKGVQSFITDTDLSEGVYNSHKIFNVRGGKVFQEG